MSKSIPPKFVCDRTIRRTVIDLLTQNAKLTEKIDAWNLNQWKTLIRTARLNNLVPFLYRSLQAERSYIIPESIEIELQGNYLQNLKNCIFLENESHKVYGILSKKIPCILLMKGVSLTRRLFRDPGVRVVRDTDLLLSKKYILNAVNTLEKNGYKIYRTPDFREGMEIVMIKKSNGNIPVSIVELHWNIVPFNWNMHIDVASLIDRSLLVTDGESTFKIFTPEDELISLAVHALHHYFALRYILDIAAMISRHSLNWSHILSMAVSGRIQVPVFTSLRLVRNHFGISVPNSLLKKLDPGSSKRTLLWTFHFDRRLSSTPKKNILLKFIMIVSMHKDWHSGFKFILLRFHNKLKQFISGPNFHESIEIASPANDKKRILNIADKFIRYTGFSMYPTFREPEFLLYESVDQDEIREGDVIVFKDEKSPKAVIHRVIEKTSEGVITKGDNNDFPDPCIVTYHRITGRVILRLTKGKQKRVWNGIWGKIQVRYVGFRNRVLRTYPIQQMIRAIERPNGLRIALPRPLKPVPILFCGDESGSEIKVIWLRKIIGRYEVEKGEWEFPVLFRLIVDISYLNEKLLEIKRRIPEMFKE